MRVRYESSWRGLADEELRHYLTTYRRRLVLLDADVPDPDVRESTRAFLALLITDAEREDALRERAAAAGVPRDHPRFPPGWLVDLKARVPLDELCESLFSVDLGRLTSGSRRGPCPLCGHGRDCFVVYLGDREDEHYKCYRCQAGGDAINAIRQKLGLPFVQAVEFLAQHAGVPLPAPDTPPRPTPAVPQSVRYLDLVERPEHG